MKYLLIPALVFSLALPALAQLPPVPPGTNVPTGPTSAPTKPEGGTLPLPSKPMEGAGSTSGMPPTPQGSSSRPMQIERKELMQETMEERKEFRQGIASTTKANMMERREIPGGPAGVPGAIGSTTKGIMMERKELFLENQGERKEFRTQIASTTKQAILERREGFASTSKALIEERRALFASSTAAKIAEVREKKEERREHFASTSALRKAEFTEEMKARILAHAEHAAELLEAMLGRLVGIAQRIDSRITELSGTGVETALAEAELAEAYDAISNAEVAVEAVKTAIQTALESETPADMLPAAKTAGQAAKEALRLAHEALKEAVVALPKPVEANQ